MNQTRESGETQPPTKGKTKILRWVLVLGAAVIALAVFLVPVFVSSEAGNKLILAKINDYLPGETAFGSLSMGWVKGIKVTDISFKDSGGQASVRIKRITTRPNYGSIILGALSFGRTIIDEPMVEISFKDRQPERQPKSERPETEGFQAITFPTREIELIINKGYLKVNGWQAGITNVKKDAWAGVETIELSAINTRIDITSDTATKAIAVSGLRLKSPQIKIDEGSFSLVSKSGKTDLEGQLNYAYDWTMVSGFVKEFLPQGLKLKGKREGTVNFSSEYPSGETDKLWANLRTKVKVGFEEADYMGLIFEPTEVDVEVEKGLLTVLPFSSRVNNGQFNFAGRADLRDKPALLKTAGPMQIAKDIQITNEMTSSLLMYLNPIFARAVNVSGIVNLSCEKLAIPLAGGNRNDIELVGTISVGKLRLEASELLGQILAAANIARAQDITIHPTRFVIQNGLLKYDDMQMYVGDNPVNFKGVIGLDKSLNMTVTLPYTTEGETARLGKETRGRRIILVLRGTLNKPEIDFGRVLEEQLRQELEERLQEKLLEGLDKLLKQSKEQR